MDLDDHFVWAVNQSLKDTWTRVGRAATIGSLPPTMSDVPNDLAIENCIIQRRMTSCGHISEDRLIHRAIDQHGFVTVLDFLSSKITLDDLHIG